MVKLDIEKGVYLFKLDDILKKKNISKLNKATEYKVNIQKSLVFLQTNKLSEREINKTIPLTIASKRIKYF